MNRPLRLLPEAEQELEGAYRWYESQRVGLGFEFLLAFDAAIEGIRRRPQSREIVARRTRRVLLRRFPYSVLYAIDAQTILVTAVFHTHRDPQKWSDRVRESVPQRGEYSFA